MATPDDRRYTDQHEWALVQGTDGTATVVRVGITDHAQDALGDIVFVQLPEVGEEVGPGTPIGEVESTKSVSDIYAPVPGTVTAVTGTPGDLMIDGRPITAPYEFVVIGDPQGMETALNIPGGVVQDMTRLGGSVSITQSDSVVVDALRPLDTPQYASPATDD